MEAAIASVVMGWFVGEDGPVLGEGGCCAVYARPLLPVVEDAAFDFFFGDMGADLADVFEGFIDGAPTRSSNLVTSSMEPSKSFKSLINPSCSR